MSLKISDIEAALRDNAVAPSVIIKIVNQLEQVAEDNKPEKDGLKAKNEFVILEDPNSLGGGYVVTIPEGDDTGLVASKLQAAAKSFNTTSRKAKKHPIKSWADLFAALPRKFTKAPEVNVLIKTKSLVRVITLPIL